MRSTGSVAYTAIIPIGENATAIYSPCHREWSQSFILPAPYDCETTVSSPEQQAYAHDGDEVDKDMADTDGADGGRPEWSDHDRVHHAHQHPPEFRKNDGTGEAEQLGQGFTHALSVSTTRSVPRQRSKPEPEGVTRILTATL
jgi:hypothetical protein